MKRIILAALVGVVVGGPVWAKTGADIFYGNYWYNTCSSTKSLDVAKCTAFVLGLIEGQVFSEGSYVKINGTLKRSLLIVRRTVQL